MKLYIISFFEYHVSFLNNIVVICGKRLEHIELIEASESRFGFHSITLNRLRFLGKGVRARWLFQCSQFIKKILEKEFRFYKEKNNFEF